MKKRVVVLGSTGSIGRQTLEVAAALRDSVDVVALGAGSNTGLLLRQAEQFQPRFLASPVLEPADVALSGTRAEILSMDELAVLPEADLIVVATVGCVGLAPTIAALKAGKVVALANKEVLVIAGELLVDAALASGAMLLPIDSEHSAIWQCLRGEAPRELAAALPSVARLILTASGGPFRDWDPDSLGRVRPDDALRHPTWQMGPKISVDSATLFNKGLEVIEAHWLFGVPYDRIDVVLHRESVVHSLVEFVDGSLKAQLGPADMRVPIQYAITYPRRLAAPWPRLDVSTLGQLSFGQIDEERFPCFRLARSAGERGGTYPAVLSAADEVAVAGFLSGEIAFRDIPILVDRALQAHVDNLRPTLDDIMAADAWARQSCRGILVGAR